jgi:hypothetical protein
LSSCYKSSQHNNDECKNLSHKLLVCVSKLDKDLLLFVVIYVNCDKHYINCCKGDLNLTNTPAAYNDYEKDRL